MNRFLLLLIAGLLSTNLVAQVRPNGYVTAGNLKVYYEMTGTGSPVILLHAGLQDGRMWDLQVPAWAMKHKVIVIDLPAHGRTMGADSIIQFSDVMAKIMDSLKIKKAAFVGLSLGSVCVTDFMLAYPKRVTKAVLVSPGLIGWQDIMEMDSISKPRLARLDSAFRQTDHSITASLFTEVWCDGPFRSPEQVKKEVRGYIFETSRKNLDQHGLDSWPKFAKATAASRAKQINTTVLIINGDKDLPLILNASNFLKSSIKGAKVITLPLVGHMLNLELPEAFNKAVSDFIDR